ncbi:kinetochore-associated protein NSL1 homolog isoform X2 [Poecile atricapillus]|uniref:kinetochore-associated protein NSL1 homolog isoform X2 n=1 Tax=Poecile atricapillus TaxID=48891 RepID=UPI00273914B5|nr:kinetochore-associated protein NSL1 homolog isoform X2 [Poecile atricapillus]
MAAAPGPGPGELGEEGAAQRDPRVRCYSRRRLCAVLELCAPFVRTLEQGQPGGAAAENFEKKVQENVTINGQPWEEASDDSRLQNDSSIKILEDQFDELIVETATRRKQWPKKILVHAIQTMKAEQEMLVSQTEMIYEALPACGKTCRDKTSAFSRCLHRRSEAGDRSGIQTDQRSNAVYSSTHRKSRRFFPSINFATNLGTLQAAGGSLFWWQGEGGKQCPKFSTTGRCHTNRNCFQ